ncbi:hypothetical protein J6590_015124 [Homalodisca vitripennis]|nr:hypothetical protein J6590_015124 [Homalodisca vitripennis]
MSAMRATGERGKDERVIVERTRPMSGHRARGERAELAGYGRHWKKARGDKISSESRLRSKRALVKPGANGRPGNNRDIRPNQFPATPLMRGPGGNIALRLCRGKTWTRAGVWMWKWSAPRCIMQAGSRVEQGQ